MCRDCNDGTLSVALSALADEILEINHDKGWEPDHKRTFGDEIALLHSEVSEALEAHRHWGFEDMTGPVKHDITCAEMMYQLGNACVCGGLPKPEGVGSEFADILIRLLHYSRVHDIDLVAETRRKIEYNKTRPFRHGGKRL